MGVLVTASLLAFGCLLADGFRIEYVEEPAPAVVDQKSTQSQASPQYITYKPVVGSYQVEPKPAAPAEDNAAHSAGTYSQYEPLNYDNYPQPKVIQFGPADGKPAPTSLENVYSNYENKYAEPVSDYYQGDSYNPTSASLKEDDDFENEEFVNDNEGYTHYKTTSNVNVEGPHQIETIETKSYHKEVPSFDISEYKEDQHHHGHKGKEVHYHQHKHIHKHEHKQEHIHKHKQEHKHAHDEHHKHGHEHKQEHKHDHHEEHKHGHEHKQEHKHDHHHGHKHGHEHKEEHKHGHHESHKHGHHHKHHQDHKHDHHHGHKHQQEHKHDHHHGHKHGHDHGHKHDHHHGHKHDHHQEHKHDHHHGHKHDHHHGHKHNHHHGHKHEHHSKHH